MKIGGKKDPELQDFDLWEHLKKAPKLRAFYQLKQSLNNEYKKFVESKKILNVLSFGIITNLLPS